MKRYRKYAVSSVDAGEEASPRLSIDVFDGTMGRTIWLNLRSSKMTSERKYYNTRIANSNAYRGR